METIDKEDLLMAEKYKAIKIAELKEAKEWINSGDKNTSWHWDSSEKEPASLEASFNFFLNQTDQRTDDSIIHFVGQEVYDLWNGYPDDNLTNRCNHARALYDFIKSKLQ